MANSGNANAATGRRGLDAATKMQGAAAVAGGVAAERVAVCSTGVIGVQLDADAIVRALPDVHAELSDGGDAAFTEGISTTDVIEKRAALQVELGGGPVRLSAQAKGAGMISPHFATLLCFVQTDAALDAATCDLLLGATCARSFERISVDGQLSTNDTVVLMASGASGVRVEPETEDELRLGEALDALLRQVAILCVRDGEGAGRVGRVVVRGGQRPARRSRRPRRRRLPAGQDRAERRRPQLGPDRPGGRAWPCRAPRRCRWTSPSRACPCCRAARRSTTTWPTLEQRVAGEEVEYEVGLPGEGADTEVFFSDLGHDYVTLNAEYTT